MSDVTVTAKKIAAVLPSLDLTSEWANTGGGVFNLDIPLYDDGDVFAYVAVSDHGEWGAGDYATVAESVSVCLYDALTGDGFDTDAWCPSWPSVERFMPEVAWASTVDEALSLVRMAVAHASACAAFGKGE